LAFQPQQIASRSAVALESFSMASNFLLFIVFIAIINVALGDLHRLFVGNLDLPASIHLLVFDDEALTLTKTNTTKAANSHSWITFDVSSDPFSQSKFALTVSQNNKRNIYGASLNASRVSSYSIRGTTSLSLRLDRVVDFNGSCVNQTSAFIVQSPVAPNAVYTAQWPGPAACGSSFKTLSNGTLSSVLQTWTYRVNSGIPGLAFSADGTSLYSADLSGDGVWTQAVGTDGKVTAVATFPMSTAGAHPKHLTAHSSGSYLYVVLEAGNALIEYSLNADTAAVRAQVNSYSLIPAGKLPS
jgi:carboxy-cis,cis-muconate cyclase